MSSKATTALIALLVFCFTPLVLADAGSRAGPHRVFVKRPVPAAFNDPIQAANDAARAFAADKEAAFAASPVIPRVGFSRGGGSARKTKPWIKLTGPLGD